MTVDVDEASFPVIVSVIGSITGTAASELDRIVTPLLRDGSSRVVVDLKQVDRLTSDGLGTLVNLTCRANMNKAKIVFAQANLFINEVFAVTQLDRFLSLADTLEGGKRAALADATVA